MKEKYTRAKKIYFMPMDGTTTFDRISPAQIQFDSLAEFNLYCLLRDYFPGDSFDLDTHHTLKVAKTRWKVDFCLQAQMHHIDTQAILAELVNSINGTNFTTLNTIYLEYKGFQDDNFKRQMSGLACSLPQFAKTVILVSSEVSAFGCYDQVRDKYYCHPVVSLGRLRETIKKVLGGL